MYTCTVYVGFCINASIGALHSDLIIFKLLIHLNSTIVLQFYYDNAIRLVCKTHNLDCCFLGCTIVEKSSLGSWIQANLLPSVC